jgi:hypothetical protein
MEGQLHLEEQGTGQTRVNVYEHDDDDDYEETDLGTEGKTLA